MTDEKQFDVFVHNPFSIVCDSREQMPYHFKGMTPSRIPKKDAPRTKLIVQTFREGLTTGDYAIKGFESAGCIERKSKSDAHQSFIRNRERFVRELERMAEMPYGHAHVVVEASLSSYLTPEIGSQIEPKSLHGSITSWSVRYGIQFHFCDSRNLAEIHTFRLLGRIHRRITSL